MIKIEHPDLLSIAKKHKQACFSYIVPRIEICIDLFNALGNCVYRDIPKSIKDTYRLEHQTVKALFSNFFKKRKRNKTNIGEITSAIKSRNNACFETSGQINRYKEIYQFFLYVKEELNVLLSGSPYELNRIYNDARFSIQNDAGVKECLEIIFNYDALVRGIIKLENGSVWNNYSITESLDISVCPYCNRNWINTVEETDSGIKITNPQLDHFFSKAENPIFRLSFFNLIPSCETCNARLKKDKKFEFNSHLHPYANSYNEVKFRIKAKDLDSYWGIGKNYTIDLDYPDDIDENMKNMVRNNYDIFKIEEIYSDHFDIVSEIYLKKTISNDRYMELLMKQFPDSKLSKEELYRLAFGNYYREEDYKRRPFSKLTKDIAKQLGLTT